VKFLCVRHENRIRRFKLGAFACAQFVLEQSQMTARLQHFEDFKAAHAGEFDADRVVGEPFSAVSCMRISIVLLNNNTPRREKQARG
jgi:hypothetical protein